MTKTILACATIGALCAAAFPALAREQKAPADAPVLVIPARYAFVKAAMDIAAVRTIPIVCYGVGTNAMALNRWNPAAKAWSPMTMDDLKSGVGLGKPSVVAVMGTEVSAVASLAGLTRDWAAKTAQIPACDLVTLINTMNGSLDFTSAEWQWLADRFNLKLKDENEQRRRYGRYGPPGQKKASKPVQAPTPSDILMPKAAAPETAHAAAENPKDRPVETPAGKPAEAPEAKPVEQVPAPATDKPAESPAAPAAGK